MRTTLFFLPMLHPQKEAQVLGRRAMGELDTKGFLSNLQLSRSEQTRRQPDSAQSLLWLPFPPPTLAALYEKVQL